MNKQNIRIATRKSQLALWQAEHVAARLKTHHPGLEVELSRYAFEVADADTLRDALEQQAIAIGRIDDDENRLWPAPGLRRRPPGR